MRRAAIRSAGPAREGPKARVRARGAGGLRPRSLALALLVAAALPAGAQEIPEKDAAAARPAFPARALTAVKEEVKRYADDSLALVKAPLAWRARDWQKAAGAAVVIGGLMLADERLDHEAQERRSSFTDRVSSATTRFGGGAGVRVSAALLAGGVAFDDPTLRAMGREAIEAGVLAQLLDKWVFKRAFGRKRPYQSNGETVFVAGSSYDSFPSGHATEAFAVASVVAARSHGWIVPTIAYTTATLVAFDRVNDRVHFASDVAAGALLGTVTGRFLVHRHRMEEAGRKASGPDLELVPSAGGVALRARF